MKKDTHKKVYLTIEQFNEYLEICLTVITYPTKKNNYYVCEYISPSLRSKSIIEIHIIK